MFTKLDHIAIVVANTDEALRVYQDQLGLTVLFSEVLDEQGVRLTHLDLGNCDLQLVEPLRQDHPLQASLEHGHAQLHHLCLKVESVSSAAQYLSGNGIGIRDTPPRRGPKGRKAVFLDPVTTGSVLFEITSEMDPI